MAEVGIREYDAKKFVASKIYPSTIIKSVLVTPDTKFADLEGKNSWLKKDLLVCKPDQLFGGRGKLGLVLVKKNWNEVKKWIEEKRKKETKVKGVSGKLTHFLVEPFVPHDLQYFFAIRLTREGDQILFSKEGGVEVEENWDKVSSFTVPVLSKLDLGKLEKKLFPGIEAKIKKNLLDFTKKVFSLYRESGFSYLEFNPLAILKKDGKINILDAVTKLDSTASFECLESWKNFEFPEAFGAKLNKEEAEIEALDKKSGASLKLTILIPEGTIWTLVAGGGASVVYTDTICDLGFQSKLANYGEYSGNPTMAETYQYASKVLDLMTRNKSKEKKYLLIGGGIANFTDVAKTFTGIIKALKEYKKKLKEHKVQVLVRRGGPNYKEGLKNIEKVGKEIDIPIKVFGPDTHMTKIVSMIKK